MVYHVRALHVAMLSLGYPTVHSKGLPLLGYRVWLLPRLLSPGAGFAVLELSILVIIQHVLFRVWLLSAAHRFSPARLMGGHLGCFPLAALKVAAVHTRIDVARADPTCAPLAG